jgi:c-di-GMP-binding flagellar brake protein YcgR
MQPKDYRVKERRASPRYGLKLAIAFRRVRGPRENDVLLGETGNISTGGMYVTTIHSLALKEVLDFSLAFPGLAHGVDVRVIGRARVVRMDQNSETASELAGVAMVTEEYHILEPEAPA